MNAPLPNTAVPHPDRAADGCIVLEFDGQKVLVKKPSDHASMSDIETLAYTIWAQELDAFEMHLAFNFATTDVPGFEDTLVRIHPSAWKEIFPMVKYLKIEAEVDGEP